MLLQPLGSHLASPQPTGFPLAASQGQVQVLEGPRQGHAASPPGQSPDPPAMLSMGVLHPRGRGSEDGVPQEPCAALLQPAAAWLRLQGGWAPSSQPEAHPLSASPHRSVAREAAGAPVPLPGAAPQRLGVWAGGVWICPVAGGIALCAAVPAGGSCGVSMVQSQHVAPRELGTLRELGPWAAVREN